VTGSPRASLVDEHAYSLQVREAALWKADAKEAQRRLEEALEAAESAGTASESLEAAEAARDLAQIERTSAEAALEAAMGENFKLIAELQRLKLFVESSPDQEAKLRREIDERLRQIDKDSTRRVAGLQRYGEEVASLFRLHRWLHKDDPVSEERGGESPPPPEASSSLLLVEIGEAMPPPGASSSQSAATTAEASELFFV
jgi:hypothetical protein